LLAQSISLIRHPLGFLHNNLLLTELADDSHTGRPTQVNADLKEAICVCLKYCGGTASAEGLGTGGIVLRKHKPLARKTRASSGAGPRLATRPPKRAPLQ